MDFMEYDYMLDMWSLGCMFAGMVRGPTTWTITDMMALITSDCGTIRSPSMKWP